MVSKEGIHYCCNNCHEIKVNEFQTFLNLKFKNKITIDKYSNLKFREYIRSNCSLHGDYKIRLDHLKDYGCKDCAILSSLNIRKNSFIKKATIKYNGTYSYDLINYTNNKIPIEIVCSKHGSFLQRADNHLSGSECTYCSYKVSINEFIERSNLKHMNKYSYDKLTYTNISEKVIISCNDHGDFTQRASSHIDGSGCPSCRESNGEKLIREWLKSNNIEHTRQYKFKNCSNRFIEYDFYIPILNICIEYDGIQHFEPVKFFGGENKFKYQVEMDKFKDKVCIDNGVGLIRIYYKDNIIDKLNYIFKQIYFPKP